MLDRSRGGSSPSWMRAAAPLVGAAIAAAIGGWLTYVGVDYAHNGCDCDEAWYPGWLWVPMVALAAAFYVFALALAARFVTRPRG